MVKYWFCSSLCLDVRSAGFTLSDEAVLSIFNEVGAEHHGQVNVEECGYVPPKLLKPMNGFQ
eukprot:5231149-Amphidinium_carterae.1